MLGTDAAGAAGFNDQVNHHLVRVFGSALLLSAISGDLQLGQIPDFGRGGAGPTAGTVLGSAEGRRLGQTSGELIRRGAHDRDPARLAFNGVLAQGLGSPGPCDDTVRP
jgi:type IV secretion system protein VirB10